MQGMPKVVNQLFKEINAWAKRHNVKPIRAPFLRFHVIDMDGDWDSEIEIEACIPVEKPMQTDGWVTAGVLPAGRYASLIYTGSGYTGNKILIEWAKANQIAWDRWEGAKGDAFRSRYETYLADPGVGPRKTKREVEVAIKLADDSNQAGQ